MCVCVCATHITQALQQNRGQCHNTQAGQSTSPSGAVD